MWSSTITLMMIKDMKSKANENTDERLGELPLENLEQVVGGLTGPIDKDDEAEP